MVVHNNQFIYLSITYIYIHINILYPSIHLSIYLSIYLSRLDRSLVVLALLPLVTVILLHDQRIAQITQIIMITRVSKGRPMSVLTEGVESS